MNKLTKVLVSGAVLISTVGTGVYHYMRKPPPLDGG